MISREAYEKFMQDIQKKIDEADRSSREKAESIIKAMTANYTAALQGRIGYELRLAKSEAIDGNLSEAERHKIRADIYQSIREAFK